MSNEIEIDSPAPPPPLPPDDTKKPIVNLKLPGSLIPMAGANAMLLVGSNKNNCGVYLLRYIDHCTFF